TMTALPGRSFTRTVARIEPIGQTTSNVVNYNVVTTVDPSDVTLLPGMTATLTIVTEEQDDVTMVPSSAISFASSQGAQASPQGGQAGAAQRGGQAGGGQGGNRQGQGARGGAGAAQSPDAAATGGAPATVLVMRDGQPVAVPIMV